MAAPQPAGSAQRRRVGGWRWLVLMAALLAGLVWAYWWVQAWMEEQVGAMVSTHGVAGRPLPDQMLFAAAMPEVSQGDGRVGLSQLSHTRGQFQIDLVTTEDPPTWVGQPYLLGPDGRRYDLEGGNVNRRVGPGGLRGPLYFPSPPPDTRRITLVLPGPPEARMQIPLISGADARDPRRFGPATTVAGVTVAARVTALPDQTIVNLLVRDTLGRGIADRIGTDFGDSQGPYLLGPDGQRYPLERAKLLMEAEVRRDGSASSTGELWWLRGPALPTDLDQVTVVVPAVVLHENARAKVTLPVPPAGKSQPSDIQVQLGNWTLRVTRVDGPGGKFGEMRAHVDPGPAGERALAGIDWMTGVRGFGWTGNQETGRIASLFMQPLGKKQVTPTLHGARVLVSGPWTLAVSVER